MRRGKFQGRSRRYGGGGGGGRGRPRHRGGRRHSRHPREASHGGNQRERIAIESGHLVFIDQFMLANPQFVSKVQDAMDEDIAVKNKLVETYGGSVVEIPTGTYRIERDPFACSIVIHPEGKSVQASEIKQDATESVGKVFVDTRCLAMIDRELLDDSDLLEKYQQLWFSGQDKACRDLLRDNGGAVRYGFQRYGDELGVYSVPGTDILCLFPVPGSVAQPETNGEGPALDEAVEQ